MSEQENGARPRERALAFVFPAFPVLHQTFVLWEVIELRRRGVPIEIYSLKRPEGKVSQPEAVALAKEVVYVPTALSWPVLWANLRAAVERPGRYFGALLRVVSEWRRDCALVEEKWKKAIPEDGPERWLTFREHITGRLNTRPWFYLLKTLWVFPQGVYLGQRWRERGITRVHAHWASYSTTVALVAKWVYDTRFSFSAHAYDIYMVPFLLPVKLREAEFAVTCARANAEYLDTLTRGQHRPLLVNYHGVNLARFKPRPPKQGGEPCVVTCGRLEPYKGHHVLLHACAAMKAKVRCILIGEGPQRAKLEQLAHDLGIADRVEFTGPIPQEKMVEIYDRADIFALGSVVFARSGKRDVVPNVLVEAMAMGIPVVASSIPGTRELIDDGVDGRLVPPNDAAALAQALDELLADPRQRERLGEAGCRRVRREFDRAENITALVALLQDGRESAPSDVGARAAAVAAAEASLSAERS